MAIELHDTASFSGTITNTASEQLVVETATAEYIELLVDDTTGSAPTSYDLEVEYYSTAVDAYMTADSQTGLTAQNPDTESAPRGQRVRVTITNSSGADEDYRVSLESFKEI